MESGRKLGGSQCVRMKTRVSHHGQDVRASCWGGQRVPHEGAGPHRVPDPLPIDTPLIPLCVPQGVITAAKELDYEICHGRYTLIVTATDQCPILSRRLTSTTTVGGWDTALTWGCGRVEPRELKWVRVVGKDCPGETPKVLVSTTLPNFLCDFEGGNEPLCVIASVT